MTANNKTIKESMSIIIPKFILSYKGKNWSIICHLLKQNKTEQLILCRQRYEKVRWQNKTEQLILCRHRKAKVSII
jgi:hypothetical protein